MRGELYDGSRDRMGKVLKMQEASWPSECNTHSDLLYLMRCFKKVAGKW